MSTYLNSLKPKLKALEALIKKNPKLSTGAGIGIGLLGGMLLNKTALLQESLGDRASSGLTGALFSAMESNDPNEKKRAKKLFDRQMSRLQTKANDSKTLATTINRQKVDKLRVGVNNIDDFSSSRAQGKQLLAEKAAPILESRKQVVLDEMLENYNNKPAYRRIFSHKPTIDDVPNSAVKSVTFNANKERQNASRLESDIASATARKRVGLEAPDPTKSPTKSPTDGGGASKFDSSKLIKAMRRHPLITAGAGVGLGLLGSKLLSSDSN